MERPRDMGCTQMVPRTKLLTPLGDFQLHPYRGRWRLSLKVPQVFLVGFVSFSVGTF